MASTSSLIETLATDLRPVRVRRGTGALALGLGIGAAVTLATVLVRFGAQPGLRGAALPAMLMKDGYVVSLAAIAAIAVLLAGRPGAARLRSALFAVPAAMLAVVALLAAARSAPADLPALLLGGSWWQCPVRIAGLSLPVLAGVMVALRRQAPTHLRRAGAVAGVLAGSVAAALYAVACDESSPLFVLIWYSLGIAASAGVGALLGPRLLRW